MPAQCVCRLLLFGWMVWEALAKSLPDLPVGKSPYGGCSTMRRWEWLHFPGLFAAAALLFSACVKSVDIKYLCSDWPLKAGLILVRGLRGPHWCCYAEIQAWNPVVMSGTTMSETAGWLQVQWSIFQKHLKLRRSAISGRFWAAAALKTWMFILLGWRGILCNYDALFTLEAILSAPVIAVCAGSTHTPSSDLRCFSEFVYESGILKCAEPCSQPPGGKQEHVASIPVFDLHYFSVKMTI